jgi:signal transduction histidine kinase
MEQLKQPLDSSLVQANSLASAPQKQRPSLIHQLVLAYSISAALILFTLIAQRTGMPILSQQYQEGMEQIWMLRLTVEELENNLTAQENSLRAYVMSGQPEFSEGFTAGRERYLKNLQQAQALTERVGDAAARASLDQMNHLVEQWYQAYSRPTVERRRRGDTARVMEAVSVGEGKRRFDQLQMALTDLEEKTNIAAQRIQSELALRRRRFLILACSGYIIGLLAGLATMIYSTRQLRRPLESFINAARRVGQGDFSIRVSGDPYVETAAVAQALNRMAGEIAAQREETEKLLQSLRQKHIELEEEHRRVEQANQFKSQFLANVTHDLRTPLSSMVLYADMLIKGKVGSLTPAQRDALQTILRRGKEQLRLVNELLDASRLDAKQMPLRLAPVRLTDVVQEASSIVQPHLEAKQVQLDGQLPPELVVVDADRTRLLQILNNLLENAVKFTSPGGQIQVNVIPGPDEVEVAITNTGEGIDPEDLPFIFDRFYRGRNSSSTDSPGSGLGLYIAKELVELHGGRLQATANGEGETTFSFTLRRQPVVAPVTELEVSVP